MSIGTGTRLGQYEVQDFLGQGAMGVVYRAYHAQLARTGAVKVMQAITPDEDSIARFRHEAQAIAQMRHPNILNVFDFGEYQGTPYMIVEYVPGGSLAGRLSKGRLDQALALKYLRGIAAGLDHAHGLGIVHRDVKPANVLLEKDDTPVLADFGLAKLLQGSSLKSMTGMTTGTPAYMAPEQVTGSLVGPAADRYSLATIAYEMLTGVIPFDGEGLMEVLYAQVHRNPLPPSARNVTLTRRVDGIVMRGLAKDPASRWESCTAFVDALAAALADKTEPDVARTQVMAPSAVASTMPMARPPVAANRGATVAVAYPTPAEPVTKRRSHKRLYAIVAAVVLLLLLLFTFALAAAARTPTMSLSSTTVRPGDSLVVTASHVPRDQAGEIELWSRRIVFSFRSDGNGDVTREILVPRDTGIGDHLVKICWNGTCHAQTTLHVISTVALTSPLPGTTPTSSPSPTASPGNSPTPIRSPSPAPTPAISISLYNVKRGSTETVYGLHFSPGSTVTITFFYQGSTTPKEVGTQTVSSSGYFTEAFTVPANASPGSAAVKVCGTNGCLYASVNVTT